MQRDNAEANVGVIAEWGLSRRWRLSKASWIIRRQATVIDNMGVLAAAVVGRAKCSIAQTIGGSTESTT
jgi:hypothetical protein